MMCDLYKLSKVPMCASARVVSGNIVYLSMDIDPRGEVVDYWNWPYDIIWT